MEDIIISVVLIVLLGIVVLITFCWKDPVDIDTVDIDTVDIDTGISYTRLEHENMRMQHELECQSAKLRMYRNLCDKAFYESIRELPTNCKNCGAPLESHKCEYCGTKY